MQFRLFRRMCQLQRNRFPRSLYQPDGTDLFRRYLCRWQLLPLRSGLRQRVERALRLRNGHLLQQHLHRHRHQNQLFRLRRYLRPHPM